MRRVAIIQSNYIPWRGYFDFIRSADLFVFYDDVQYSTGSWRNRNRLKTSTGPEWITVPVNASLSRAIDQTPIASAGYDWRARHRRQIEQSLGPAPYFGDALRIWEAATHGDFASISALNIRLTHALNEYLGIRTRSVQSREFHLAGHKTERLIELLRRLGADAYLSGPSARQYLDEAAFRAAGIQLEYKTYDYAPYPQLWGAFEGAVSILDLIANTGAGAPGHLASRTPSVFAVPAEQSTTGAK